jgi:RNA polymerase sigma-70 factor (ECF subfamily)
MATGRDARADGSGGSVSPWAGVEDSELLARHADGDAEAFGELVRRHRDRLWAVALRTLGDPDEAADALQDALVSAFRAGRSSGAYRGQAAVTTWLHRIVVNACLDRVRRARVRPTVPLPPDEAGVPTLGDGLAARDTAMVVADALATLPADQRAAIVLVDLQGFSIDDAAAVLDVAPGTVKSRCSRGRARLLPLLASLRNRTQPAGVPPEDASRRVPHSSDAPPRPEGAPA